MNELAKVSRFEVIDHTKNGQGRVYVKYANNIKVETSMQDANRTLKVFISDTKAPIPVSRADINKMYALTLLKQVQPDEPELDSIVEQLAEYIRKTA